MTMRIGGVRFTPGTAQDREAGLLGFVRLAYGDLVLDSVAVRRTAAGNLSLSWPARCDRRGREHALVRPLDDAARIELERAILAEIGLVEPGP